MTAELLSVEEYAAFVGARRQAVSRWIAAGFVFSYDIEPDGRLYRLGASLDLILRVSTAIAIRIFFAEQELIRRHLDEATAAFKAWSEGVRLANMTLRGAAIGWQLAESVRVAGGAVGDLRRLFSFSHLEAGASERRRILRKPALPTPEPPEPFDHERYLWELRHPVIDPQTRAALRAAARQSEKCVQFAVEPVVAFLARRRSH